MCIDAMKGASKYIVKMSYSSTNSVLEWQVTHKIGNIWSNQAFLKLC